MTATPEYPVILTLEPRAFDAVTLMGEPTGKLGVRQFEWVNAASDVGVVAFAEVPGWQFDRPAMLLPMWSGNPLDLVNSFVQVQTEDGVVRYQQLAVSQPTANDDAGNPMIVSRKDRIVIDSTGTTSPKLTLALCPLDADSLAKLMCCNNAALALDNIEVREGPLVNPGAATQILDSNKAHLIQQVQPDAVNGQFILPINAFVGQIVTIVNESDANAAGIIPPAPGPPNKRINFTGAGIDFVIAASGGTEKISRSFKKVSAGLGGIENWAVL